ncbi:uncharacterized protein LOC121370486 [Gigantopelta aegis]|uniref:uncharacterized protein LOC121370486 n=1 Tax=Gigantopelta aegis TaxID=1735272 RepID=UPI001B88CD1E|nr:uncharacterized protein LOC121370486 [Gigantopelta aegis]
MSVLAVAVSLLLCLAKVLAQCSVDVSYDLASTSPTTGVGYMEESPVGSVTFSGSGATFTGTGMLKMYKFSAIDWRGIHSLLFNFQPTDPTLVAEVSLMTNDVNDNAGSFMITWSANQVKLKVSLRLWNTTTLQFDTRTDVQTITGLDLTVMTNVLVTIESSVITFQAGPLTVGGYPTPVTIALKHDEHIEIVGWDPLIFGKGTATPFSGVLQSFTHYNCIPIGFFF